MTETKSDEQLIDDAFDRALAANPKALTTLGAPEPAEEVEAAPNGVAKSDTSEAETLDQGASESDSEATGDHPSVEPKALARATSEVHRAGLAALLKGKSESEILALGTECETARRERDREFRERRSLQPDASAETGSEAGPDGSDGTGDADPNETSATPADLDKLSTVLTEELGEEAARLVTETQRALVADNAALRARLDAMEQERQLAPAREAANKVLDGLVQTHPDLSNPESRAAVLAKAEGLPALNKDKYDAIPEGPERLAAILEDAALLHFGPGAGTSAKRKVADPPASTSIETPDALPTSQKQAIDIGFEKAWKKARMRG